ncbi:MAG TPA: hypothetical protein VKN76_04110 [Kiloniellaceae bacterium]|nr:hypothetical protein [Kiloniellaceae bacterium]
MSHRMSPGRLSALLLLVPLLLVPPTAAAQAESAGKACRSLIVGGYVSSIENSDGSFASRSLLTFHSDGALNSVDARQFSGDVDTAFSAQQGRYRCSGRRTATATTLDFGFSGDGDIGRADYRIVIEPDGSLSGDFTLTILTPLATCNPFDAATCSEEASFDFTFTAERMPD